MNTSDLPPSADAVIVGGGIAGTAAAFFLSRAGLRPVIVERLPALASLTTARSMEAMRAQWMEPENVAMMRESIEFYERFAERVGLPDCDLGVHQPGYLFLTARPDGMEALGRRVALQHGLGLTDVELLDGREVRRRFPYVSDAVTAATYRQRDGWLAAHEAALGFARASGARVVTRAEATGFRLAGGRVVGVETTRGPIAADVVVIAAGPYSGRVAALLGVDLPLRNVRRHRVTIGEHPLIPQTAPMVIDQDTGAHWRPERPGAALAWAQPHEPPGEPTDDVRANPAFVHEVMEAVSRLCPFWEQVAETLKVGQVYLTAGQYTETPDDKPIIGPHPDIPGLYFNCGYGGHGIMAAPGGGRLLADLVTGAVDDRDNPFSFRRLARLDLQPPTPHRLL
ncbi:MAG: FAD-binding oxidoreductase [Caldilineales bacterium]|nr:FAD-binding oxidoreductase [Caldilineales bacterium]MDW8317615.1 FAD-binding oxidoreductase [Anaerolineae bacterium]